MTNLPIRKDPIVTHEKLLIAEPTRTRNYQWQAWLRQHRWLLAAALVPLLLVWALPILIAHSPMMGWVLDSAAADLNGKVTAKSASLGWFSGVWLGGVEVRDERDQVVMEAPEVAGNRSLLGLMFNSADLGRFRVREPKLYVALRDGGSNLEDLLAKYLASKTNVRRDVSVEVVDGSVALSDGHSAKPWEVNELAMLFHMPLDRAKPIELTASGTVPEARTTGRFTLETKISQASAKGAAKQTAAGADVTLKTEALPMAVLNGVLDRLSAKAQLGGRLSSTLQCRWNSPDAPDCLSVQGTLAADKFSLAAAALGSDRVELDRLQANCQVAWQDGHLQVDQLVAESDVGNTSLVGQFRWDAQPGQQGVSLLRQSCEVRGQLDLVRLAKMLPNTLRIRKGTQITSGRMTLAFLSRPEQEGMVWQGRFETTNLTASSNGGRLVWEQPLLVTLAARETNQGPIIEDLRCESSFLKVGLAGTRDQLKATARFDLNSLAAQLAGFVDMGGVTLAGDGEANFTWKRSAQRGGFEADGDLTVRSFQVAIPKRPVWREDSVVVIASATGRTDFSVGSRLEDALIKVEAGTDHWEARLLQPVAGFQRGGTWDVDLRATGQIARWMPRVGVWTALADWNASGAYDVQGRVNYSPDAIRLDRTRFAVTQLDAVAPWLNIHEPVAEVILSGRFDPATRRLQADEVRLSTNNVSAQAVNLVAAWPAQGTPQLSGSIDYQGSVAQVQQWFSRPGAPAAWQLVGNVVGKAEFHQSGDVIDGRWETAANDLVASHTSGRNMQATQVRLAARGKYGHQDRTLQIAQLELVAGSQGANLTGSVGLKNRLSDVQLSGQINYDLDKLSRWVQAYTGSAVQVVGKGSSPISFRGPLALDGSQGSTSVKWDWADVFGFRVESGVMALDFQNGVLKTPLKDMPVSEGRLSLEPEFRFNTTPAELFMPPGQVITQARMTPAMCAAALQYVAPVLAGISSMEGKFSVELLGCRIPLANPAAADVSGRITLHSAQVGAGPLIQEFALLLGRASPAKLNEASTLQFRMVEGRIYHQGLDLAFPDLRITTYGSVGLDQTLAMVAEMPIPPKWRDNRLLAAALKDRKLQIPIGGTLQRPQLDRRVLDQISRDFLQSAARNTVGDVLTRGFEQLVPQTPQSQSTARPNTTPQPRPNAPSRNTGQPRVVR